MRALLVAVLGLLFVPLAARAETWQTSSPEAQGMSSRELTDLVTFGVTNGMDSLLVVRHGNIVAEAYYAPFTVGLKHRLNSATKSVVGTLVAIAHKDGLIASLDKPVLDYFPDRQFAGMDERKKAMALQHLLDMTSGLDWTEPLGNAPPRSFFEMERSSDWVQYILDHGMAREPGAAFDYDSGNPHLLSAVLSKVTGRSAREYAREKLFGPLGIEDVLWRADPQGVSAGGAGLYMQPRDMARLGRLWLGDGVWNGQRLLPTGWIEAVRHAKVEMGLPGLRYANLFWSMAAKDAFMAVGFHRQLIVVAPGLDVVAVFTGASRYSSASGGRSMPSYGMAGVLDRLKAAVKSGAPLPEDPAALAELADKVAWVARERRTESGGPPAVAAALAAAISGKVYRLQPNQLRLASFSLTFENGAAAYAYEFDGQRFGGPIGLEGLYGIGGRRLYGQSAAKGRWLDERTFQLEVLTPGNDDAAMATLAFEGESVTIGFDSLFGIKAEIKGTASQ